VQSILLEYTLPGLKLCPERAFDPDRWDNNSWCTYWREGRRSVRVVRSLPSADEVFLDTDL